MLLTFASLFGLNASADNYKNLSANGFAKTIADKTVQVLDCRTLEEFTEGHIPGALLADVKLESFEQRATAVLSKDAPVAVYCRSGKRSLKACEILVKAGYGTVYNLKTGINGWKEAGKPVTADTGKYQTMNTEGILKVHDFIKACGHYFIATVDGDQPRVRPFGTVNVFEGKLYIQTGHVKNVARQIQANGKVELCAFNGQEWIRLSGTLVEDARIEARKAMLDAYPSLRSMYDENDANTAVYYFTDAVADICSFTKEKETIKF